MKILIVDDQESNRLVLKYLLESDGHQCIEAADGQIAVRKFQEHAPDLVLLDVVMPVMDGYEAARLIKEYSVGYHVPIIFLTAKQDEDSLLNCLESGGDDYLTKPINDIILQAKIRAHARTQELTEQLRTINEETTRLHAILQREHEMGQYVLNHTLQRSWQDCPNVTSYISSLSVFNGDLFLVAQNPSGGIYVFLGDFTGHGLAAAIGAIPLSQSFYDLCDKGKAVMDIATGLNAALKFFLPEYLFCTALLLSLNQNGDRAVVWSGGLPNAHIIRPGQGVIEHIVSHHMPLGILAPEEFESRVQVYDLAPGDRLLLLTDGILESTNESGHRFGEARLLGSIGLGQEGYFERLLANYKGFRGTVAQQDDISLVEIKALPMTVDASKSLTQHKRLPWHVVFCLQPEQLKTATDPIHEVVKMLPDDPLFAKYADRVHAVLSELYSNSLEHGLLRLDSTDKKSPKGFSEYYEQRAKRLFDLQEGLIEINLDYDAGRTGHELTVRIEDSGSGFEHREIVLQNNTASWGRGLALVKSLCQSVSFSNNGTRVEVSFAIV